MATPPILHRCDVARGHIPSIAYTLKLHTQLLFPHTPHTAAACESGRDNPALPVPLLCGAWLVVQSPPTCGKTNVCPHVHGRHVQAVSSSLIAALLWVLW